MKNFKDDFDKFARDNNWEKFAKVPKDNEVLRITFYKTPSGIKAESRGAVKGTADLTAVTTVLSDVLSTSIHMLGKHNGINEIDRENNSGEYDAHEWDGK